MFASALTLLGIFVANVLASPAAATSAAPAAAASVLTPQGLRAAANVHEVPKGGKVKHVGDEIHLLDADGTVVHVATPEKTSVKATATTSDTEPLETGWIAYAYWYNTGDPINLYYANWNVPNTPSSWVDQTLFYFNSIEPGSGDAILQPVLQYGPSAAGGGEYWSIATWYLYGSDTYYTPLVEVSPGNGLQGIIELTGQDGSSYDYLSGFAGQDGLQIDGSPEQLVWATITLEVYSVQTISNFPSNPTTFSGINIGTTGGTPGVTWSAVSDSADGINTQINAQGAVNAEVTFTY